jgi:hypothetical protein
VILSTRNIHPTQKNANRDEVLFFVNSDLSRQAVSATDGQASGIV